MRQKDAYMAFLPANGWMDDWRDVLLMKVWMAYAGSRGKIPRVGAGLWLKKKEGVDIYD